ncbi:hypothetical protein R5W24_001950 [Gemmata sp. JC717]|uniref:hypothetical protein n=1 Tax=Gemmata algarum TaxID=2975278 RepID=UPI0021BB2BDD|nr:hypothetical protein [Gemmata algarum]MDY3552861.1 hypothetical protein [Gemmata algarum]
MAPPFDAVVPLGMRALLIGWMVPVSETRMAGSEAAAFLQEIPRGSCDGQRHAEFADT